MLQLQDSETLVWGKTYNLVGGWHNLAVFMVGAAGRFLRAFLCPALCHTLCHALCPALCHTLCHALCHALGHALCPRYSIYCLKLYAMHQGCLQALLPILQTILLASIIMVLGSHCEVWENKPRKRLSIIHHVSQHCQHDLHPVLSTLLPCCCQSVGHSIETV